MNGLRKSLPWLALALIAGAIWFLWPVPNGNSSGPQGKSPSSRSASANQAGSDESAVRSHRDSASNPVSRLIESSLAQFRDSSGPEESQRVLAALREGIRSADPQVAAAAVLAFLKTGDDVSTHLPFSVGNEGMMDGVSSLRIALLDLLPSLDPELALEFSRAVMDQKTNPDEYALALRNLAWSDLNGDSHEELMDRLNQMIQMKDWLAKPSAGFLEAIDAAVFVSNKQAFEILASLNQGGEQSEDKSLGRATFIGLDRIVLRNPEVLIQAFESDPGLNGMAPKLRASLMSRLDIANPGQREVFTRYLSDPSLGNEELDYFVRLFPNGNYIHGNWLMSGAEEPQSIDQRKQSDAQVIAEIDRLRAAGGNGRLIQAFDHIKGRLVRLSEAPIKK